MSTITTSTRSTAEKLAANERAGIRSGKDAKPAKSKAVPKVPTFPDDIREAVRYARIELSGKRPNLKPDQRPPAASAGDHIAVRTKITEVLGGNVTPDAILRHVGLTFPRLVAVAQFRVGTDDDLKKLRAVGEPFAKDKNSSWRTGRYLAGVLAAWVAQLRAEAKKS